MSQVREKLFRVRSSFPIAAVWSAIALFTLVLFRTAWVCDDAYITLRTVDNFVDGYGLRWNAAERVQSYTHPLWMLLLTAIYLPTRDAYFTAIAASMLTSFAAVLIFAFRIAPTRHAAAAGVLLLTFSYAHMDYATSGLENPLSALLAVAFVYYYVKPDAATQRGIFRLSAIAALAAVNRHDSLLMYLPALIILCRGLRDIRLTLAAAAGAFPLYAWELFSLVYYGSLVPNTAYAKLNTGIPSWQTAAQGFVYFYQAARTDPITPFVIAVGILTPWYQRDRQSGALALGMLLYLLYIVRVGGDFMAGRFLALPYFMAAILVVLAMPRLSSRQIAVPMLAAAYLGLMVGIPPVFSGKDAGIAPRFQKFGGITDERGFYFQSMGLFRASNPLQLGPEHAWIEEGTRHKENRTAVVRHGSVGLRGFYAGPTVHIIDTYALCDPLLARMPAIYERRWRVGHYARAVPAGYDASLESGENQLKDPDLAQYYEHIRRVTRGPLFAAERWRSIWLLNTRQLDHLIDAEGYRFRHREVNRRWEKHNES